MPGPEFVPHSAHRNGRVQVTVVTFLKMLEKRLRHRRA